MTQQVADHIVRRLQEWGVEQVFGYPGDRINGLVAAFGRADVSYADIARIAGLAAIAVDSPTNSARHAIAHCVPTGRCCSTFAVTPRFPRSHRTPRGSR
ncbi:thiamine pyrophosphate-binding protein [Nocardia sp. CA-129566]|uniref:thiamine pyrophosphate-binding protein n=1 Tax=Nocardia sp. CA-129566 TaxID=3239976 RepID=UPI003D99CFDF